MTERNWNGACRPLIAAIDNLSEGYGKCWKEMCKRIESNEFGTDPSDAELERDEIRLNRKGIPKTVHL